MLCASSRIEMTFDNSTCQVHIFIDRFSLLIDVGIIFMIILEQKKYHLCFGILQ